MPRGAYQQTDDFRSGRERDFWLKVRIADGDQCWEWTGAFFASSGYGVFHLGNKTVSAHRTAYTFSTGPIPKGSQVLHHCDNRKCCRPDHLFVGSHEDNMQDMTTKGRNAAGERHPMAKLTEQSVREIRASY